MDTEIHISDVKTRVLLPAAFPHLLRHIPSCPEKLYIKSLGGPKSTQNGSRDDDAYYADYADEKSETKFLCVVGSRRHTGYAARVCRELILGLAGYNICIISGLALGIDSIAHETALEAGLRTIAFPGSGLDPSVLYPARNQRLADRIIEAGGALLSEFEPTFRATEWGFPKRNRLMAGSAHATLIIEAGEKSGTLITSAYALDFNRDVFAVPGDIFSPLSYGPHKLISDGAAIITQSIDILHGLGIRPHEKDPVHSTEKHLGKIYPSGHKKYSAEERRILEILIEPMSRDTVIREAIIALGLSVPEINALISMMELSGLLGEENAILFAKDFTSV